MHWNENKIKRFEEKFHNKLLPANKTYKAKIVT